MQVNDNVWVQVSRDKERAGVVKEIGESSVVVSFGKDTIRSSYSKVSVRPMSSNVTELKTATKHDDNKNRLDLIPVAGIEAAGRAFTFGAKKYNDHNWANGFAYSRLLGACLRHVFAYVRGQDKDPESGLSHIDHALACLMMLAAHETEGLGNDDRRKTTY